MYSTAQLETLAEAMGWQFCQIGTYRRKYRLEVRLGDGRPVILLDGSSKTKIAHAVEGMLALVELAGRVNVEATLAQATDEEVLAQVHERDSQAVQATRGRGFRGRFHPRGGRTSGACRR